MAMRSGSLCSGQAQAACARACGIGVADSQSHQLVDAQPHGLRGRPRGSVLAGSRGPPWPAI
eukprot:3241410-Pyramimonas_sp.AAC.1